MTDPSWKKIVLVRDPVEVYSSLQRAKITNVWIVKGDKKIDHAVLNQKVRFDEESWKQHVQAYGDFLSRCGRIKGAFVVKYVRLVTAMLCRRYSIISDQMHARKICRLKQSSSSQDQ